jgi:hypothetical protein
MAVEEAPIEFLEMSAGSGPPPGIYSARFLGLVKTSHPEYGDGATFKFEIAAGEHAGKVAVRTGKLTPTATNVTGRLIAQILGRTAAVGEKVSLKDCVGKPYTIVVEKSPKGESTRVLNVAPAMAV